MSCDNYLSITDDDSILYTRFHSLKSTKDKKLFVRTMQAEETDFLLPVFSVKSGFTTGKKILETMTIAKNPPLRAFSIHPRHYTSTQEFWKSKGLLRRLSTGEYSKEGRNFHLMRDGQVNNKLYQFSSVQFCSFQFSSHVHMFTCLCRPCFIDPLTDVQGYKT